jgi:hypothetical protein
MTEFETEVLQLLRAIAEDIRALRTAQDRRTDQEQQQRDTQDRARLRAEDFRIR